MWRTPLGARALQTLGVTFEDDGTFWLSWEDFQAHFNKVYVVRVVDSVDGTAAGAAQRATPEQWFRYPTPTPNLNPGPNPNPYPYPNPYPTLTLPLTLPLTPTLPLPLPLTQVRARGGVDGADGWWLL